MQIGIGIASLPNQRYRSSCAQGLRLNLLLVGGRGCGKRSLVHTLLGADLLAPEVGHKAELRDSFTWEVVSEVKTDSIINEPKDDDFNSPNQNSLSKNDNSNSTGEKKPEKNRKTQEEIIESMIRDLRISQNNSNSSKSTAFQPLCSLRVVRTHLKDKRFNVILDLIEANGVGDCINNEGCWVPLENLIKERNEAYAAFKEESANAEDPRVHAALVFVDTPGLTALDKVIIQKLSTLTTVVPIKARSDALTDAEADYFFKKARAAIDGLGVGLCDPRSPVNIALEKAPFLVAAAPNGTKELPYGTFDVNTDAFKDLRALKALLIDQHMLDLIAASDSFHRNYMASKMAKCPEASNEEKEIIQQFSNQMKAQESTVQKRRIELMHKKRALQEELAALEPTVVVEPTVSTLENEI